MQLGKNSARWKHWLQLDKPARRRELGLFLVEGPKLLEEALRGHHPVRHLLYDPNRFRPDPKTGAECLEVSAEMLARLSDAETCQGVVALCEANAWPALQQWHHIVLADGIADPGNLGSLMRTARAAGAQALACLGGVDPFGPKVVRSSAGAVFHLPCYRLESLAELPQGLPCIGLSPRSAQSLYQFNWPEGWVLAVGSEAHGLSPEVSSQLQATCTIPMADGCESLNAGVSAAIVLFEWRRQRQPAAHS